mmetsp:Transcript_19143/g.36647  ORF Transcript_19143/g.36647 Transcript_19143/m.36647 type:complete len:296 (+) Transcript_19143:120-1007(+)
MPTQEGFLDGHKGHRLYHKSWLPSSSAAAAHVFYFPGVHESLDLTAVERLVAALEPLGVAVHGQEYHGHGRSSGQPGLIEGLDLLLAHALQFVKFMMDQQGAAPFFVMGHSMGGGIVALLGDTLQEKYGTQFAGAVMLSPSLDAPAPPALLLCLLRAVCTVWPAAALGPPEDPYASFAVQEEARKYNLCPHNYKGNMRLGTGKMFVDEMFPRIVNGFRSGSLKCDFPFLIVHAENDHIPISASKEMMNVANSHDKELHVLQGGSHQILTDPGWEAPLQHVVQWISRRASGSRDYM